MAVATSASVVSLGATSPALAATKATPQATSQPASASTAAPRKGTVTDVREVQVKGQGSGVGVVAGAVVGGLLGNQIGRGSGNTIATVGGAVAGGYAGNEVEKNVKKTTLFKTTVKLDDGSVHEYSLGQRYAVGARVQVNGKKVTLAP
ncbi:MAG: glycine zipper 2TM domain-containing protein [Proteobacteria bacterium]|nr:glycine zipper 2TM domain-containing protein [Pseudomonadota bacterium]